MDEEAYYDLFDARPPKPKKIVIDRGLFVACEAGHVIAEITAPIREGQMNYQHCVGFWRIHAPQRGDYVVKDGEPALLCPCGAPYWRPHVFHIEGSGWVGNSVDKKSLSMIDDTPRAE